MKPILIVCAAALDAATTSAMINMALMRIRPSSKGGRILTEQPCSAEARGQLRGVLLVRPSDLHAGSRTTFGEAIRMTASERITGNRRRRRRAAEPLGDRVAR